MSIHAVGGRGVSVDALLSTFDEYLANVRGASMATRDCYGRHVRVFLDACAGVGDVVVLEGLSGVAVRDYVTRLADKYAPDSVKLIATSVRCFLLLLSRLGLRANEVAALRLADLDWRAAQMTVRVKGGGILRLPIPHDAGEAVVEYLRIRPQTEHREVFLRVRGVPVPLTRGAVTQVVQRSAELAGLGPVHAHRLRHTLARQVLDAGGSLAEVGQLLGHGTEQVTMMYSSMDLDALRPLVRAWPAGDGHA